MEADARATRGNLPHIKDTGTATLTPLATAPFTDWKYEDCTAALTAKLPADYWRKRDYAVLKDHFRGGKEWVGPGDAEKNEHIAKQFVPDDFISDALRNIGNAFEEPQMGGAPIKPVEANKPLPENVQSRITEAMLLFTVWWDKQKIHAKTLRCLRTSAYAGYATLRPWVPSRFLVKGEDGAISFKPTTDFATALSYIHIAVPEPHEAGIVTHPATQDLCAIFLDEEVVPGTETKIKRAEMVYLDPDRDTDEDATTILRVVYENSAKTDIVTELNLGGRLFFAEMEAESLLTEPVLRTQQQLNFYCTILNRLAETGAFKQRYIKNAKPHGKKREYTEGEMLADGEFLERDDEHRLWAVTPEPRTLGAATTTELVGLPNYDDAGSQKGNQVPDVFVEDPTDPTPYVNATEAIRKRGLRQCSQGHLAHTSTAELSGIAYEQFRATHEKDLNNRRIGEEGMLRDLLMAVLALAEYITGKEGYFTKVLRVTIDQRVNAGPRSPDSTRLDMEAFEAGLLSEETTMARIQVEDIEAEVTRLRASSKGVMALMEHIGQVAATFSPEAALRLMKAFKVPQEVIDALTPQAGDTPAVTEPKETKPKIVP
jgi:hypothetical protein